TAGGSYPEASNHRARSVQPFCRDGASGRGVGNRKWMALSVAPDRRRRELARLTVLQTVQPRAEKKRNEAPWRYAHNNLGGIGFRAPQFGGDDAERARSIAGGIKATGGDGPAGRVVGHRRGRGRPVAPRARHHELLGPAGASVTDDGLRTSVVRVGVVEGGGGGGGSGVSGPTT